MATKKKAAKPVAKKVAPAKKAVPAKKAAAKPAPKAVPVKKSATKPAPAKAAAKPPAKAIVHKSPAKGVAKPAAKPVAKAVPKATSKPVAKAAPAKAPVKSLPLKPVAKSTPAKAAPAKPAPVKTLPTVKPVAVAKPEPGPTPVPVAPVKKEKAKKPPVKKIIRQGLRPMPPKPPVKDDSKQTTPIPIKKPAPPPEKRPTKLVMPEIKTKTVQPYHPDFTKSVLDQNTASNPGPTMRYSDNELQEFRELINKKLDAAKKELAYLQGLITRKDEMGGDESESRYMTMEDGSVSMEREQLAQMASRQITFIDHLEKAVMRIENKTYGICRVTGKLIDKARLRAVPHATLSIEAKNTMNK